MEISVESFKINWPQYQEFLKNNPESDTSENTRIQILSSEEEVDQSIRSNLESLAASNLPSSWASVGIVFENRYHMMIQDPVKFPDGRLGTYTRMVAKPHASAPIVIFPVYQGKIVLLKHFRHAARNFQIEVPRGCPIPGKSHEETAVIELKEEISAEVSTLKMMGRMATDGGIFVQQAVLFFAELSSLGSPQKADGICEIILRKPEEFCKMIADNQIFDSYTIVAYLKAQLLGYL